jgi:ClpX C4-type zinc finger
VSEDRCSFCNELAAEVDKLVLGPSVSICDECVEVCVEIIVDDAPSEAILRDPEKVRATAWPAQAYCSRGRRRRSRRSASEIRPGEGVSLPADK